MSGWDSENFTLYINYRNRKLWYFFYAQHHIRLNFQQCFINNVVVVIRDSVGSNVPSSWWLRGFSVHFLLTHETCSTENTRNFASDWTENITVEWWSVRMPYMVMHALHGNRPPSFNSWVENITYLKRINLKLLGIETLQNYKPKQFKIH